MIEKIYNNNFLKYSLGLFFILVLFFSRSFMGIYLFGFRIGELSMGFSLLVLSLSLFFYKERLKTNNEEKKIFYLNILIILFFILNSFLSESSFASPYTYKVSSYIWTLGFFYLGVQFFKYHELNSKYLIFMIFGLIYLYFFSIYGLPEGVVNLILSISDKFEPHKGSDLVLMFSCIMFISNRYFSNKRLCLEVFTILAMLYLPLLLFKSRGAFIAFLIFSLFEFIYLRGSFNYSLKRNLLFFLVSIFILIQSIFLINGSAFIQFEKTNENVKYITEYRADPDDEKFRLLYYEEDFWRNEMRFYSTDNNLNWRLQIWQDVYYDIHYNNLYFTGYGYKNRIPAMEQIDRQGLDRLNEHVHNYIVTIYARGGLTHLLLFFIFYFYLIKNLKKQTDSFYFLPLMLSLIFTALFDVAMENSHFPLIFYFILGMSIHRKKLFKNI